MKKARALHPIAQMPAPDRCGVCTTPARCQTAALGKSGKNCAGKDNGPDICDCLNDCGDDARIAEGKATPCQNYIDRRALAAAKIAKQRQLEEDAARWRELCHLIDIAAATDRGPPLPVAFQDAFKLGGAATCQTAIDALIAERRAAVRKEAP